MEQLNLFGGGSERVLNRTEARKYIDWMLELLRGKQNEKV